MRVVAFTKYDREAASTRQRILQFAPALEAAGIELEHRPLLDDRYVRSLATGESYSRRAIARSYARRLRDLLAGPRCDAIWVYAELFPYLPATFERLVFRAGVPIVYDFDDAFFLAYDQSPNPLLRRLLSGKLEPLIAGAAAATCGNAYLRDYAAAICPLSIVLPTVVDTDVYRPVKLRSGRQPTIGWIGSPSSWANVRPLLPVLRELCIGGQAKFRVIGAGAEAVADRFNGMQVADWSVELEISEVQQFDIGIMPLVDAPFQRGKSGYKLIQYMACGVPAVASPVGVNSEILERQSGILAYTPGEWRDALATLLDDTQMRRTMGEAGRKRAIAHYSLAAHAPRLVDLFRRVIDAPASFDGRKSLDRDRRLVHETR
jgi:glycosyltransferase involved in cell wall biosynthesis